MSHTPRTDALMHLLAGIELTMPSLLEHAKQLEAGPQLALLGIERMLESVQEDLKNEDPGNYATIAALHGEGKGLTAAKMLLEGALRGHHVDHVSDAASERPEDK